MKIKRLFAGVFSAAIIASSCPTVFGADFENIPSLRTEGITMTNQTAGIFDTAKRNDEQAKSKYKEALEKWKSLTDAQKEEIYSLKDVSIDVECRIIDKYLEFGIIDNETASEIKAKKIEFKSEMRKNEKMPGHGFKHHPDKKK